MIAVAVVLFLSPSDLAYTIIILILSLALMLEGIRGIVYYFRMARHMVGGKIILVRSVIVLDFAIVTESILDAPRIYILIYLIGIHAFSGVVEVLRSMEAKRTVDGPWKLKMSHGLMDFALAVICLLFIRNSEIAQMIYCIGLVYSAVGRISTAFSKTSFVLIE